MHAANALWVLEGLRVKGLPGFTRRRHCAIMRRANGRRHHGRVDGDEAASLARRGDRRDRSQPADRRRHAGGTVAGTGRASRPGVSRSAPDAAAVSGGGIGFRSADAAALFATQHAGLPGCRTGLAPQRPTAGRAVAHRSHQPRVPPGGDTALRRGDSLGRRRHQRRQHARCLCRAAGRRAPAARHVQHGQQPRRKQDRHARRKTARNTASRSCTRWCARIRCTARVRCIST